MSFLPELLKCAPTSRPPRVKAGWPLHFPDPTSMFRPWARPANQMPSPAPASLLQMLTALVSESPVTFGKSSITSRVLLSIRPWSAVVSRRGLASNLRPPPPLWCTRPEKPSSWSLQLPWVEDSTNFFLCALVSRPVPSSGPGLVLVLVLGQGGGLLSTLTGSWSYHLPRTFHPGLTLQSTLRSSVQLQSPPPRLTVQLCPQGLWVHRCSHS